MEVKAVNVPTTEQQVLNCVLMKQEKEHLRYIDILFNAPQNTSFAMEMLDGLAAGGNITWNVLWQRNLRNNLPLYLNYEGRISEDLRLIQTKEIQERAFF